MDEFSYLSVLLSVILGLAVTQILKGFRGLLLSRARIQIYGPVIGWAIFVLLLCFQNWWSMFAMRYHHDWNFEQFTIVLLRTILIYMIAGLVFPDLFGDASIDLRESFYSHRRWFFFLGFAVVVVSVCADLVLYGKLPNPINLIFHGIFGITLLVGASTKNELYHKALVISAIAVFILYIVLLYARIQ